jgi:ribosomal protein S18 acetylase RimI-like enzyme
MYRAFEPKRAAQGLPPEGPERIDAWLDSVLNRGVHLVAEAGGQLVGHVMVIPLDQATGELASFVDRRFRSRGLGTKLNRAALDLARDRGWRRVWLCVDPANRAAIRSYRKAGFTARPGTEWAQEVEMIHDLDRTTAAVPTGS